MLSYSTIADIRQNAAQEAKSFHRLPLSVIGFDPGDPREFIRQIPFLGDYIPAGWKQCPGFPDLFVDKSGCGSDNEPALSLPRFIEIITECADSGRVYGFAIYEEGEFQVYVRVYIQTPIKVN